MPGRVPALEVSGSVNPACGPGQDRSTALFHLATELPAAALARLLGIHSPISAYRSPG
jgi:hypothetical protein